MSLQLPKDLQSRSISWCLRSVEWFLRVMPRWLTSLFVEGVFPIVSMLTRKLTLIGMRNLQFVYGDSKDKKEYERISRQLVKSIAYGMMDLIYYVDRPEELSRITHLENEECLKRTLGLGKGVIAVSAHLGNFPLMFIYLAQKGYKVNVIIRNMRDENFSKFIHQICAKWGVNMIQTSPRKKFLKDSLAALSRHELLFILLDEIPSIENGVKVEFLDREAIRAKGPILFLERTSSPILPMFIGQDEKNHFKIFVEEPFEIEKKGTDLENMDKNINGLSNIVEHFVKRYPFQWGGWLNRKMVPGDG